MNKHEVIDKIATEIYNAGEKYAMRSAEDYADDILVIAAEYFGVEYDPKKEPYKRYPDGKIGYYLALQDRGY